MTNQISDHASKLSLETLLVRAIEQRNAAACHEIVRRKIEHRPPLSLKQFLAKKLFGAEPAASDSEEDEAQPRIKSRGRGVHIECYHELLENFKQENTADNEPPTATPWRADFSTICPFCHKVISEGDQIVITNIADWR